MAIGRAEKKYFELLNEKLEILSLQHAAVMDVLDKILDNTEKCGNCVSGNKLEKKAGRPKTNKVEVDSVETE